MKDDILINPPPWIWKITAFGHFYLFLNMFVTDPKKLLKFDKRELYEDFYFYTDFGIGSWK